MKPLTAAIALLFLTGASAAAGEANPDAAKGIVSDYCADCHEVAGFPRGSRAISFDAPDFSVIAMQRDPDRIRQFLRRPHYPMTQFVLSASDIENLVAFISAQAAPGQ